MWISQGLGETPNPGDIQAQARWVSEKPDLNGDVPAYCNNFGLGDL